MPFKKFFGEWKDRDELNAIIVIALLILVVFLTSIWNNYPDERTSAGIFMFISILALIIIFADLIKEKVTFVSANLLGQKPLIPLIAGLGIGAVMVLGKFVIIGAPTKLDPFLSGFIYIALAAPLIEEVFFRGALQSTFTQTFSKYMGSIPGGLLAIFMQVGLFVLFHLRVLGFSMEALQVVFIFGLIATIGTLVFKSLGFSLGLHFSNNFLIFMRMA